ncbi:hypothetical protein JHK85_019782 [Glycine max]|nr:hypothetical protein JHK85_019782 [Glycine max]
MTTNKWLNIVVDGNSALGPYWPKIVSDYLEKIVSEYLKGERHCILVATGDPVAKSMLVNLPLLHKGIFISGQFKTLDATFINVAKIFVPGNGLIEGTDLITDHGKGQLTVLLSRNFKEAQCIHSRTTLEEDPLTRLLEQEQPMPLDEILGQVFRSSTSTSREGSLPQNAWSTEVGASSFGFPNTLGNSLNQFQPPSFPILYPYDNVSDGVGPSASAGSSVDVRASAAALVAVGAASSGAIADAGVVACANVGASPYYGSYHQQFPSHHRFEMSEINPIGTSSTGANPWGSPVPMMPEYNEAFLWPEPPTNFEDYVQAWEWPSRLEIVLFLPKTAVSYTTSLKHQDSLPIEANGFVAGRPRNLTRSRTQAEFIRFLPHFQSLHDLDEATTATTNGSIVVRGGGSEVPEVVAKDIDDDVGSNKLVMKLVKNGVQWWPHH